MAVARKRPTMIELQPTFCPGCGHGNASRLLAEVIEEKGLLDYLEIREEKLMFLR